MRLVVFFACCFCCVLTFSCEDRSVSSSARISAEFVSVPVSQTVCDSSVENRATVYTYEDDRGELRVINVGRDEWIIVIAPERTGNQMFSGTIQVCNLPDTLMNRSFDGAEVIFSGIVKEVYPTENMPGNISVVSSVFVRKQYEEPSR